MKLIKELIMEWRVIVGNENAVCKYLVVYTNIWVNDLSALIEGYAS